MIGKNNHYLRDTKDGTKVESYSIKKFKVGAASVVIGASIFLGAGAVAQASEEVSNNTTADNTTNAGAKENVPTAPVATAQPVAKETTKEDVAAGLAAKLGGEVKALDKTKLESYIAEIEEKLANGAYDNKTEESVAVLKEELKAAKATLADATTQDEITKAYSKLVTTANTKLKNKPVEKKETPAVDTTNGKETVGKKAENTEKKSESNSIENTGSKDPRNGKALDKNNAFRAETTETSGNFNYSMEYSNGKKEIYLYNEEEADVNITVSSTAGNITKATVKGGSGQFVLKSKSDQAIAYAKGQGGVKPEEEKVEIDGYGWSYHQTLTETQGPVTIKITGKPNDEFKKIRTYTKTEDQEAVLGARFLQLKDSTNAELPGGRLATDPGYFRLVVKSQTYKYDIQQPESNADKIAVSNVDSLTEADITKIKNELKIKYSDKATTEDARLASKRGEVVNPRSSVVKEIAVANGTVTVTYNDDSVDTAPVSSVARTNVAPTVSIPFSDPTPDKKDIYIYNGEEVDIDITFNDDSGKIKSAALKRGGNQDLKDIGENKQDNEWGLVTTVIKNETTTPATIKITGTVTGVSDNKIPKTETQSLPIVSRFATATDLDGEYIKNQAKKFNDGTNIVSESYKTDPGAFTITLQAQTKKYDVAEPTAKISVANPNSITEAELENIKNNISLEYSKNNNDARLADKKGERVTDSTPLIKDVKQDTADANKLVVTYKDGSTDKIDKSKFIKGGPAPTVNTTIKAAGSIPDSVPSSDSELTGTGTPGATVKVTVKNPETGAVISEKTAVVGEDGTWKLPLEEGLNSNTQLPGANEAARRFFAPKNPVEITQVVNGIESESRAVSVAVGESKILPSPAAKDGKSVVAGAKEVTITVPHDAGRSYFFYTNKGATSTTEVALEQSQNGWSIVKNADKATIKSVEKGVSVHTITLTMNENALFQEGDNKLEIISHNGPSSPPSRLGRYKINVTNEKPTLASKNTQTETTVNVGDTVNPISLVTAADHEDDKDATLGTKVHAEVISVNGDESVKTVDTTTAGRYEVKYKAVDSQGKESDVLTHTVIVNLDKQPAIEAVEKAAEAKIDEINKTPNATDDEKQAAIDKVNTDKAKALTAINEATAKDALTTAKDSGTTAIAADNPVVAKKDAAKADVETARKAKEDAIKANPNLTQAEKDAAIAKNNTAAEEATKAIDSATTNDAVDQAKTAGTGEIAKVNPVAKEAAKKAVADELAEKEKAIDKRTDLTDEEKEAAKEDAKAKAKAATDAINAQPDNAETPEAAEKAQTAVNDAKDKGVADVKAVNPVAKEAAKKAVADELAKKEEAIDKRTDLTDEEKAAAKDDAKAKAKAATDAIDAQPSNATTPEEAEKAQTAVDTAKTTGENEVRAVNPAAAKKPEAKKAVEDALKAKVDAIDARTDLTDDEKKAAKDKAAEEAKKAKEAIDAATTDAAVDTAKTAGTGEIAKVNPVAKEAAKKAVADELAEKEKAIDARTDLTDAEKTVAKDDAKAKAKAATDAINAQPDNAATPEEAATAQTAVNNAKDKGVADVKAVNPVAKEAAKKAVADELAEKEKAIDARTDLTDAEKTAAKDDAKAKAKAATDAIDAQPSNAATPEEAATAQTAVNNAKDKGVADVKAVNPVAKEAAKKAVADELAEKEKAIDAQTDLTDAEKTAAKDDAKAKAKAATDAIDAQPSNATTPEEAEKAQTAVNNAKDKGVADVKAVNPVAKEAAKKAVADELAEKEKAIDKRTDLTDEEKAAAKDDAKAKAKAATDAIDAQPSNAATPEEAEKAQTAVNGAKDKGVADVKAVDPEAKAKPEAKKAIDEALKAKEDAIDARTDLTDDEKKAAKEAAKEEADKAKAAVDAAPSNAEVDKAKEAGTGAVEAINPEAKAKPEAKKAVDDALKAKEEAIDGRTDLTPAEKQAAKDKAAEEAKKAKEAIDAATTDAAVDTAKTAGTGEIAKVNPVAKTKAKDEIAKELAKKEEAIDARTDLTDKEKEAAKEDAKAKAKEATDAINAQPDNAETPEKAAEAQKAVDGAKDKGVADVKAVNPVAKEAAKKAIADELAKKEEAINGRTDLTDEEKAAAKKDAQDKAKEATDAINAQPDNAATPEEAEKAQTAVNGAKDKGVADVKAVDPAATKKPEAKKAVDDALKAKEEAIDAREDLTPAEKQVAKDKAAEEAKKAKEAIDAATTDAAVDKAKEAGTGEIAKVNPVAKEAAKKAIADELAKKEEAIDGRTDLTDAEKAKAKEDAQAKAKEATDAINAQPDNAETPEKAAEAQKAVDGAKDKGVADVKAVNPIAKEAAKKAIADELAKKEEAIDGRTDLTDEEKVAAKKDAQDKAKEATNAIDAQPSNAETPEKAAEAQTAVNGAKDKGVADVKAVDPAATKKPEAKKAVDDALKAKVDAIDAREDLTPAEKQAAKDKAAEEAKKAKEAIDAATTDAAVDKAKEAGTGEIAKVNPVAKEAAKKAIEDELSEKEKAIDGRTDLTDEEKAVAKKDAQDKAKEATDAINAQPDNAETPEKAAEAQKAVDGAKDKGVADVKAVNPVAKAKPEAKKAIDDKLAKQLEDIANTPDATDEEKKVAADAAKALADQAKKDIDNAKKDEDVKKLQDEAKDEIEKSVPVVEDKPNARKAIEDEAKAKKEAIDARTDLTPKAKEDLKAEVDAIADQAKKAVDKATSATDVDKIEEADKAAIKAVGEVKEPVDKTLVKDPANLTDAEKAKLLEEVKKVNPTAKEVKYDKDGNIEVTTQNGDKGTIKPADIVKTEKDLDNGKGGNDINKPIDKVIVKDPANLTDADKAKIVDEVKAVNPNSIVTIDDKGTVTVSTPDGETAAIPAAELVRTKEDTTKPDAGNSKVVKPADKVVGEATDPAAQAKVEEKLKDLNPTAKSVKFDEKGNATVTLNDGTTATIPAKDLFKSPEEAAQPNAGNDIVKPADKAVVKDPANLTDAEKKAIEDKVKAVNPGATVVVDDKGNTTVTTPEGKTAVIPATDLVKSPEEATKPNAGNDIVKPADKTVAANPEKLTDAEKKAIEDKVKAVNPGATVVVDDKGNTTVTTPEGKTAVIPATDLVKSPEEATKPNAGNDIVKPADKTVAANPEKLTDAEKKAIEDKVKAVNPGATVAVDDKGNATVTTPEGKTAVIPATDLVKSPEEATKPNAGNDIVKPADKTVAANPEKLTDAEKKAIEDKVKAVNPGATVAVDDKGNTTVTTPEGKTAVIPATDLVKSPEEATKPNAGNDIVKPADKTVAANPEKLTDAEKKAIEDKVKAVNPGATVAVDDKGNATVTTPEGKTAVIPATDLVKSPEEATKPNAGNDIVKPADKTVAANPEKLTDAEKKAIEDKVKAVNPGATVAVDDKGNATVTTPEGKTAVIPATDLVKSPEEATKPNAGNDIVKPADKTVAANPEKLTDAEKKAIEDKVKAVNPGATVAVDDKGNATVTTPEGKTAVIPATDLTKSPEEAAKPNAGNDIVKPADKTVAANPEKLTDAEKKAIEDKVKAVNPGATVAVDDKGNATVTTPEGKTAVIPATDLVKSPEEATKPNAGNDIVKPADKTVAANPEKLTDAEKKAIEDKVKAVNPGATVAVDDKGNATVTTPEGKTAVIPATDLVKSPEEATKPNAGNDIVKPADKTVAANPEKLTDAEKKAIEDKVKAVNPGATVAVDDKGNATVTTPEGKTAVIPATDLVKSPEEATKPNAGNDIVKPADKTVAANPEKLTDAEKKAIEDKVKAVNPGATVAVDDKGNATVTTPEGKTAVIPATDLVKSPEEATKPNAGNDIVKPADKTVAANPEKLTDAEKKAIEDKVKAVNPGATVVVDDKGNTTVTTPEGKTAVIPATDLVKSPEEATKPNAGNDIVKPADKTVAANPDKLTDAEKKAIEDKVKAVNPGATVAVDDKGNATVTTPEGKTAVIPATDLVKSPEEATKPNAGNDINTPAGKVEVKDPAKLTDEEKAKVKKAVEDVNPGSKVVVDGKGNATVTTPEGKTAVVPAADVTKSAADADKANAGNAVNTPAGKVEVKDPAKLTDEEKAKVKKAVEDVNPGSKVVVDDKGNATVTTPEGKTAVVPAADVTKSAADADKANAGNVVNTPAGKVEVKDPANLTDEEKAKVKKAVEDVNPGSKVVVDDKGNATVTTPEGKTAVVPAADVTKSAADADKANAGNAVNTPAGKVEVKDPANLTDEEKAKVKKAVEDVNPGSKVVVDDKGNATVTTPEGKTATIPGADVTKSAADADKANAGNVVNTPAGKVEVKDPAKLTDEEKAKVKKAVEDVNPGSKVVVDDKGNATVTTPEGKTAVVPAADVTKSAADADKANAGNVVNTPAGKVEVKDPAKLTDEEKAKVKKAVEDVNPGSKVVVDDKGNATVTTPEGKTATIPAADVTKSAADADKANAGNVVNTPAGKVEVKDPAKLTDEEKAKVKKAVEDVNPGSKVVVDDKGNATVTTPEGKTATIPGADVTKSAADADKANAGNVVNTPAGKVEVKDPAKLTDEEKAKVKKAVEDVNPGSKVVVDDKGNATVTTPEGKTATIPGADVTKSAADAGKANAGNVVNTPATRVLVGDKAKLTADEIEKVKESVKAVNPGSTVVVDDKGNATVTTPEGKTATIPAAQLVKDAKDVAAKNNGDNINLDFEKETVVDFNNLTDAEKEAAKAKIKGANADVEEVIFDKAGNATVITKDGKVYTIAAKDIFRQKEVPTRPGKVVVENQAKLTDAEKEAVKQALIDANPKLKDAEITIADNGEATIVYPDGQKVVIPASDLVEAKAANNGSNGNGADGNSNAGAGTDANAGSDATNGNSNAQDTNAKVGQRLANTGTTETNTGLAGLGLGILGGLLAAARRRKNDKN